MPRIIMQVIKDEYQLYKKTGKESGFGEYMNTKYPILKGEPKSKEIKYHSIIGTGKGG